MGTSCVFRGLTPLRSSGGSYMFQYVSFITSLLKTSFILGLTKVTVELLLGVKFISLLRLLKSISLSFQSSTRLSTLDREAAFNRPPFTVYLVPHENKILFSPPGLRDRRNRLKRQNIPFFRLYCIIIRKKGFPLQVLITILCGIIEIYNNIRVGFACI